MSTPLLATKISIPARRPGLVPRPHLLTMLNEGLKCKLTLVAAPAGYGKTTLLSDWINQIDAPGAWLSLERSDNDLNRFLAYFFAALQEAQHEINQLNWTSPPAPQKPAVEVILTSLLNQLTTLSTPLVLVLDDFHLIAADPIYQSLAYLLEHLPAQMHLVIATRADPRLPIAQLRAKGELVELREADLRFKEGEISLFLENVMGLNLSGDQIAKLASRTEGWIVGLQLAAISMQGRENLAGFIEEFSGSHEYVMDYLTDEVLRNQPQDIQTFLLRTSILEKMCAPLCEAVAAQPNAQATLEMLRDAHLFVLPLDDERRWYRFHQLFADHLQKRLKDLDPDQVKILHQRAGDWFELEGMMAEAIEHRIQAEDFEGATNLLDQITDQTMMNSEFTLYLRWTAALPTAILNLHPLVGIAEAMSLLMTGTPPSDVELMLDDLNCETDTHLGGKFVVQATIAVLRGQLSEANKLAQQAVNLLAAGENQNLRDVANWILSYTSSLESKPSQGLLVLSKVIEENRTSGNQLLLFTAYNEAAKLYSFQGKLRIAIHLYEEVLNLARDEQGNLLPLAGESLIGLGELLREQNNLEQAEQTLERGILLSKWGRSATVYRGYISLAKLCLAKGDVIEANRYFQEAKEQAFFEFDQLYTAVEEVKGRISQGDLDAAELWLGERVNGFTSRPPNEIENAINKHIRKYEDLLQARILYSQNRQPEALTNLEKLLREMEQQERSDLIIEIQILRAMVLQQQGKLADALDALNSALSLARPGGYVRIFLDEGEAMIQLLYEASARGIQSEYVGQLLAVISRDKLDLESTSHILPMSAELAEPLSERELQVLRLLASPLTSTEIAGELFISVNTARFHIKNIYAKLGVHSRAEALERARELGMLP